MQRVKERLNIPDNWCDFSPDFVEKYGKDFLYIAGLIGKAIEEQQYDHVEGILNCFGILIKVTQDRLKQSLRDTGGFIAQEASKSLH